MGHHSRRLFIHIHEPAVVLNDGSCKSKDSGRTWNHELFLDSTTHLNLHSWLWCVARVLFYPPRSFASLNRLKRLVHFFSDPSAKYSVVRGCCKPPISGIWVCLSSPLPLAIDSWIMSAWNLACGFARNKGEMITFRFLSGFGGSGTLSVRFQPC